MQTIRLRVNEKIYKNLMWLLNRFGKDELEIIEENDAFLETQAKLKEELTKIESGKGDFLEIDQLNDELEATIRKYED